MYLVSCAQFLLFSRLIPYVLMVPILVQYCTVPIVGVGKEGRTLIGSWPTVSICLSSLLSSLWPFTCVHLFLFFFNLTYSRWTSSLPSCLWSQRIFPSLPGSRLTISYRDASSALLQLVNQWLNFTYSRSHAFRYEIKEVDESYFGKNRTHDFRTGRCAGYLLDHSS